MDDKKKNREYFIKNMKPGNVIAFNQGSRMLSGKVQSIEENSVVVKTKNGSIFFPAKEEIVWVLTGSHWPVGIYNALRYNKKEGKE